ncbi:MULTISPECIES: SRPBCC family protein [Streptomyces]|uniref:SRPBCC family protein n=1 Tax=Streptomyces yunnanensis TaxID=156453 RepID=A0ABY8AGN1_9ACTN|nr:MULTISPECIES: SRPBCC family protein [Streptomyces]AJC60308.1 carbon monoxide dehydrogenase subunit G [Streptomyces sp. 769]WEB44165.1 SRPBCC family protein [Streptomyces yunnanensis]
MQLSNTVPVNAAPDAVFTLVNDVQRVASCMPGAVLDGRDGDAWQGRVRVKVGPITTAYAGTVRFLETDADRRRLRVQARGADAHGNGDAEAEVTLTVAEAPEGARLELVTDLVIRGKLAQFGKGAIGTVSTRILEQFARNLGGLLEAERGGTAAPAAGPVSAPAATPTTAASTDLDGLSVLLDPALRPVLAKYGPLAVAFTVGVGEGWLLGRLAGMRRELRTLRRGRA